MDWGMKHQLGNLYENTYEQIINGDLVKDIVSQMRCEDSDVICRDCEWAIPFDENKWKNYLKTGNYTTSLPFYKRIKNIFFNK